MGHYGGKPREGARAGADHAKYNKEIARGRVRLASSEEQRKEDLLARFDQLTVDIDACREPNQRESLSNQLANFVASGIEGIITVNLVAPFVRESELHDPEKCHSISRGSYGARTRNVVLPLHHAAKLLTASVPESSKDFYIYAFRKGGDFFANENTAEVSFQCLKSLLVRSLVVLPVGRTLSMKINDRSLEIANEQYDRSGYGEPKELERVTRILQHSRIGSAPSYELSKISSGDHKAYSKLIVTTTAYLQCKSSLGSSEEVQITYLKAKRI